MVRSLLVVLLVFGVHAIDGRLHLAIHLLADLGTLGRPALEARDPPTLDVIGNPRPARIARPEIRIRPTRTRRTPLLPSGTRSRRVRDVPLEQRQIGLQHARRLYNLAPTQQVVTEDYVPNPRIRRPMADTECTRCHCASCQTFFREVLAAALATSRLRAPIPRSKQGLAAYDDPILRPEEAAAYCGLSIKTLKRRGVRRVALGPKRGTTGSPYGYRRSTLNTFLNQCEAL